MNQWKELSKLKSVCRLESTALTPSPKGSLWERIPAWHVYRLTQCVHTRGRYYRAHFHRQITYRCLNVKRLQRKACGQPKDLIRKSPLSSNGKKMSPFALMWSEEEPAAGLTHTHLKSGDKVSSWEIETGGGPAVIRMHVALVLCCR